MLHGKYLAENGVRSFSQNYTSMHFMTVNDQLRVSTGIGVAAK